MRTMYRRKRYHVTMRFNQEFRVGLFATVALGIVYWGANFLKGNPFFSNQNFYQTVYADGNGLNTSSLVMLNGVPVGKVRELRIRPDQGNSVLIVFETQQDIKLTDNTKTRVISPSFFGGKAIDILFQEGEQLKNYDTVQGVYAQDIGEDFVKDTLMGLQDVQQLSSMVGQLLNNLVVCTEKMNGILVAVENTTTHVNRVIHHNESSFQAMQKHISEAAAVLTDEQYGVRPFLIKLNHLIQDGDYGAVQEFPHQLNSILGGLGNVLKKVEGGGNTLGRVLEDDDLYKNINQTIVSLNQLLTDFKTNPGRYIRFSLLGSQTPSRK